MKVIIPTTPLMEQIVGPQKRAEGQRYRLMTYVVQQPVDDGVLLYNTLTCSLVLLTPDEAADITAQQELIDRWFLVPQDYDDRKACREIRQLTALFMPTEEVITLYTILTTTGCNARCFYCFERRRMLFSGACSSETSARMGTCFCCLIPSLPSQGMPKPIHLPSMRRRPGRSPMMKSAP